MVPRGALRQTQNFSFYKRRIAATFQCSRMFIREHLALQEAPSSCFQRGTQEDAWSYLLG